MSEADHVDTRPWVRAGEAHELVLVRRRREAEIVLSPHVPATRETCIAGSSVTGSLEERRAGTRMCGAIRCPFNLYRVASVDRPGRRRATSKPGDTIEITSRASCCLDHTDLPMSAREISKRVGISTRRVEQLIEGALRKLAAAGVTVEWFRAFLDRGRLPGTNLAQARSA